MACHPSKETMKLDKKLLQLCLKGDRKGQFKLYEKCFHMLMSVCIRYKQDQDEAAEMLNQGFLKILTNLDKYQEHIPFEAWAKRIMVNVLIDDFRKNRKVKELIEYTDYSNYDAKPHDQVDYNAADLIFDAEMLERMIRALPPMNRKVFNLFAIDGFNHKEISELLGISVGTSKWHLNSARKKLKAMMKQHLHSTKVMGYGK